MSALATFRANILPCLGLIVGPSVWALNTQLGQILPYAQCGLPLPVTALLSTASAAVSLLAGFLSWRGVGGPPKADEAGRSAFPASFPLIVGLSGLFGLIFAFALLMQGAASLWLSGCER